MDMPLTDFYATCQITPQQLFPPPQIQVIPGIRELKRLLDQASDEGRRFEGDWLRLFNDNYPLILELSQRLEMNVDKIEKRILRRFLKARQDREFESRLEEPEVTEWY